MVMSVRIRAEPLAVVLQRGARRRSAARPAGVLRLEEQPHRRPAATRVLEALAPLQEVGLVVQAKSCTSSGVVVMRRRAVAFVAPAALDPGGADDPSRGHRQADVVDAEVGEELGRGVELMAVPSGILEHADLRKPLRDEVEVADGAGARERARALARPRDLDVDRLARLHRRVERHSITVRSSDVPVVGRDEAEARRHVGRGAAGDQLQARDLDPAPVVGGTVRRRRNAGEDGARASTSSGCCARRCNRGGSAGSWPGAVMLRHVSCSPVRVRLPDRAAVIV